MARAYRPLPYELRKVIVSLTVRVEIGGKESRRAYRVSDMHLGFLRSSGKEDNE